MSIKRIIGALLLASPFIALFCLGVATAGLVVALKTFATAAAITAVIIVGAVLVVDE